MNITTTIHSVVETTVSHKESNGVRWTEIVVVDKSGNETQIVLFPEDKSEDLQIDNV